MVSEEIKFWLPERPTSYPLIPGPRDTPPAKTSLPLAPKFATNRQPFRSGDVHQTDTQNDRQTDIQTHRFTQSAGRDAIFWT